MKSFAGRVFQDGRLQKGVLWVDNDGRVAKVAKTGKADDHTDLGTHAILPGAIDVHVHLRDPGQTHKEDLHTGTVSAAFGGVTGVVEMPNTLPPTTSVRTLREKHRIAQAKVVVDYGLWGGATWYTGELEEMLRWSVGMKVFLGATTGDLLMDDPDAFRQVLEACGRARKPVILHCEAQRVLDQYRRNEVEPGDHDRARPPLAEVESIYDVMKALPGVKPAPRVHIAHVASTDAVQAATAAKFSLGVCPHHLLLTWEGWEWAEGYAKVNPPIRRAADREALWQAFASGRIPVLESDHAPHTTKEKEDIFPAAPAGIPGVETMVPLLLARVVAGDLDLATLVSAASAAPAALLGLTDRGGLEPGMRADFAVYDLDDARPLDEQALHSKCGWSPYGGLPAVMPSHTYLAGEPVVADGRLVAEPGTGQSMVALPGEP